MATEKAMAVLARGDRVLMLEVDTDDLSEFVLGRTAEVRTGTVLSVDVDEDGSECIEVDVDAWSGTPPRASFDDGDRDVGFISQYRHELMRAGSDDVELVAVHLEATARKLREQSQALSAWVPL